MPRQTGLLLRKGRYYFNFRIPTDLRPLYGKKEFLRESLGTSDFSAARREVQYRVLKAEAEFDEKRKTLLPPVVEKFHEISDQEAHSLVFQFLRESEKDSERWWEQEGWKLDEVDRAEALENLQMDEAIYSGGIKRGKGYEEGVGEVVYAAENATSQLDAFLKIEGVDCPKGSQAYDKLQSLFHLAVIENIQRSMDRLAFRGAQVHQPLFREVFSHTAAPAKTSITLGELLQRYEEILQFLNRADSTKKTYKTVTRLLSEVFGKSIRLDQISTDSAENFLKLLRQIPLNSTKVYPGKTLEEAIKIADSKGNQTRLSPTSLKNYFVNLNALFNFAVRKKLMVENPFKDRYLREAFAGSGEKNKKAHFTVEQLNTLFRTPLYRGCQNDKTGYGKEGPNKPRRGRFWVPLLALFHGLRCNEAAQLYTEDVGMEEGIPYLDIRATRADGSKCDKRLKTEQSARRIPLHPELVKLGFLDFVSSRRADETHPRLFPELTAYQGYFSNHFSKWFGKFKDGALGTDCKATFHSFRHHFRTALGDAGVPIGDVELLGGWESGKRSSEKEYDGASIKRLLSGIEKVEYPGLDLSHLYRPNSNEAK